jgi:Acyl-coenzyme A synthetases/AMP-(fatty) acid ligases
MSDNLFSPNKEFSDNAYFKSLDQYNDLYNQSISNPENFWAEIANRITWFKKWDKVREYDFIKGSIKWFDGAKLNVSYNCLDRHVENGFGEQSAIIWEGNNPQEDQSFTYNELLSEVKKFANVLKKYWSRKR